ncbi:transposase, MuDR, MULE transposase domain protein [Tanacetum coccineum]|uniref:Transposase, MuDR, MULE transposase domain protein n=1 Tax=Tanacetum coccineum TaxID=301880 RepID=A0ABQ5DY77_9ASTR
MTSNSVESINNLTRHARKAPITQLMEWYRALLQKWYCAHRDKYKDSGANTLSDWATHKVMDRMQKSAHWKVLGIDYGRLYQVDDRRRVHQVDLTFRTCTCRKWQLSGIPCGHVIAVSRKIGCTDCSHLALGWFRKTTLYSTYQDLVYPVGEPSSWVRPDGLQVVKPPNMNFRTAGRPKNTEAIVVPPILVEHFELKQSLINMMTSDQFFGLEKDNPHDHIRWFNKITSTIKYRDVPNSMIKLMLFPFSLVGSRELARKRTPRSILLGNILVSKSSMILFLPQNDKSPT